MGGCELIPACRDSGSSPEATLWGLTPARHLAAAQRFVDAVHNSGGGSNDVHDFDRSLCVAERAYGPTPRLRTTVYGATRSRRAAVAEPTPSARSR